MAHQTFFKGDRPTATVERRMRKASVDDLEEREKAKVRRRDKGCRFPLCGCGKMRLAREVSHQEHKGAGGNPTGSRSVDTLMVQACRQRHRLNTFSIDKGTIAWEALTARGANGPIRWLVDVALLRWHIDGRKGTRPAATKLVEVGREVSAGFGFKAENADREALLEALAEMVL